MRKFGFLVLLTVCMLVLMSIFAAAAFEPLECDPEKVGIMRAERNCDNTGDAEEDVVLAQRACYDYARVCTPKWTDEQLEVCKKIAEKTCLELSGQAPVPYEQYDSAAGFQPTDVEQREAAPDVGTITEEAKKEVAKELGLEEETPPAPEPTPAPEPAPVEEKGMSAGTIAIIIIIIIIILVVLWYFLKGKKKKTETKKKK